MVVADENGRIKMLVLDNVEVNEVDEKISEIKSKDRDNSFSRFYSGPSEKYPDKCSIFGEIPTPTLDQMGDMEDVENLKPRPDGRIPTTKDKYGVLVKNGDKVISKKNKEYYFSYRKDDNNYFTKTQQEALVRLNIENHTRFKNATIINNFTKV